MCISTNDDKDLLLSPRGTWCFIQKRSTHLNKTMRYLSLPALGAAHREPLRERKTYDMILTTISWMSCFFSCWRSPPWGCTQNRIQEKQESLLMKERRVCVTAQTDKVERKSQQEPKIVKRNQTNFIIEKYSHWNTYFTGQWKSQHWKDRRNRKIKL